MNAALSKRMKRNRVTFGLCHFPRGYNQMLIMEPVPREHRAIGRLRLGDLILMVCCDVVHAASVDVERLSEILSAHGGAFEVPAGKSRTKGARKGRKLRLCEFPQRKGNGG